MIVVAVKVKKQLFLWKSFDEWCARAARDFRGYRSCNLLNDADYICVDSDGNACTKGAHFMAARDANLFPVACYLVAE